MIKKAELTEIVKEIINGNEFAKSLLFGTHIKEGKPHSIENWIQVEIAKKLTEKLKKEKNIKVDIESVKNHDINISRNNEIIEIELKLFGKSKDSYIKDIDKLKNSDIQKGFLIIIHLLKKIKTPHDIGVKFKERAAVNAMIKDYATQIDSFERIENNEDHLIICCIEI